MKKLLIISAIALNLTACSASGPKVLSTEPLNGAKNVDPNLTSLSVTFSEPMMDGSWSWAYANKDEFPLITGEPVYTENNTVNSLPVQLEPGAHYVIWLNTQDKTNFKSESGTALAPYQWEFWTE